MSLINSRTLQISNNLEYFKKAFFWGFSFFFCSSINQSHPVDKKTSKHTKKKPHKFHLGIIKIRRTIGHLVSFLPSCLCVFTVRYRSKHIEQTQLWKTLFDTLPSNYGEPQVPQEIQTFVVFWNALWGLRESNK